MKSSTNLKYQFLGQGISKLFSLLFYIILARSLGEDEFGKFSYALTICLIFGYPLTQLGLDILVVKWVSRGKLGVARSALRICSVSSLFAVGLIVAISYLVRVEKLTIYLLMIYLISQSFQNILFAYLRGQEYMKLEGILLPIQRLFYIIIFLILLNFGIKKSSSGAFSIALSVIWGLSCLRVLMGKDIKLIYLNTYNTIKKRTLIKEALTLTAVSMLWMVYFRVDSFMLGIMRNDIDVGIYNAAYRLVEGIFILPGIIMIVYFPKLAKKINFNKIFLLLLIGLGALGTLLSITIYLLAPFIIKILYAGKFTGSISVLQILSITLFFVFIGHLTTQSLIALDMNKIYLALTAIGASINILLNYFLILIYGPKGAALSTVFTEGMITLITGGVVWEKIRHGLQ